ncbi:MAG: cation:proton antiporter [Gemmatales bacterium]
MHPHIDLILTLTGGLAVALMLGYITHRVGLSPIVGYLLAGFVVGPHTPGFVANHDLAKEMAEVGVILLMFGVGLHFHLEELFQVRRVAIPGAIGQSLLATLLGCLLAWYFNWGWSAGLVFGLAISVASTVVLLRVLSDNHALHTPTGHIAVGWLVVEDTFTVLVLVLLPALFGQEQLGVWGTLWSLVWSIIKLALMILFTFFVGQKVIPWLLGKIAETKSRELFTLTVLVLALGIAVGSAKVFDVSMALGAFLAGMVVGRSDFSLRAASEALPMRDAFAVLFFVSVGMMFDPMFLLKSPGIVLATLAIVLLAKPLIALLIVVFLGYPVRVALSVAVALAQIGEFSFILADLGTYLKILPPDGTSALVFAAIVSISLNPLIYRTVGPLERWLRRQPRLWAMLTRRTRMDEQQMIHQTDPDEAKHRAIVIGYGPIGRTVTRLLSDSDIIPTIIEMNLETVQQLRSEGIAAVYGDASHRDTLKAAGVDQAIALLITASSLSGSAEVIRLAREMNPDIRVIARTAYLREVEPLQQAGADAVFAGEGEVAISLTEFILRELGATPEQIDREGERMRKELIGTERLPKQLLTPSEK